MSEVSEVRQTYRPKVAWIKRSLVQGKPNIFGMSAFARATRTDIT